MSRCVFLFQAAPLVTNYSGAASRYAQNFWALRTLCDEVHVIRLYAPGELEPVLEFEKRFQDARSAIMAANSWQDVPLAGGQRARNRLQILRQSMFDPVAFEFPYVDQNAYILEKIITEVALDFLLVEHTGPAAIVLRVGVRIPWIYSHHDVLHRLRQIRYGVRNLRDRWFLFTAARAEKCINLAPDIVFTASLTEADWLRGLRSKPVSVIPMAYPMSGAPPGGAIRQDVRIIHLGSLETTANRQGLATYLRRVHDKVIHALQKEGIQAELWVVGDHSQVKSPLSELLIKPNTVLKGFVPNLSEVMRPYDIAILPYENDTGFRTKLPLFFLHAQVVVTTRAAVAGMYLPGLENACVMVEKLDDFFTTIVDLAKNPARRKQLGREAYLYYQKNFTYDAVLNQYHPLLNQLMPSK